jgi:hypothetical protein
LRMYRVESDSAAAIGRPPNSLHISEDAQYE